LKVLTAQQIKEADAFTIKMESISSIDLMERASHKCFDWIIDNYSPHFSDTPSIVDSKFDIVVGTGNNGGDGLAIGRLLADAGADVSVIHAKSIKSASSDFLVNLNRLKLSKATTIEVDNTESLRFRKDAVVIDCIFGIGLNRPVKGSLKRLIQAINSLPNMVVSIDVPSGLMSDGGFESSPACAVMANYTLSFQTPKLAFFIAENSSYTGQVHILDINLHPEFLRTVKASYHLITKPVAASLLKKRMPFDHKGLFGHALIMAGSKGMRGAATLTTKAALRSGCGLVTLHTDKEGAHLSYLHNPEAMVSTDPSGEGMISDMPNLHGFSSIAIGPGLGHSSAVSTVFKRLIQKADVPLVIDADAINILASNPTWLSFLPHGSILTPHPGEFSRLVGGKLSHFENIQKQRELSQKFGIYILLKGGRTTLSLSDGQILINDSGNPGMATAGMGDTLTGIIVGLLSSGYSSMEAASLGMFVHGYAGDLALTDQSQESLIASDVINYLGRAFKSLHNEI